ncbi:hypothetical protein [Lichenibacterium dinghuense]|uniref:hypothetical protein n=1 Tax=Lichenibacterium dinghuense TaxID=2895977 RepID=UPI001F40BBF7|nr:hypothetical protein [Lichenibacterium sp. 6Y81]
MLFPWYAATMLSIESNGVIGLRLMKMTFGGPDAQHEAELMVSEKVDAFVEAAGSLCGGATAAMVIGRYREYVAANASRLAA